MPPQSLRRYLETLRLLIVFIPGACILYQVTIRTALEVYSLLANIIRMKNIILHQTIIKDEFVHVYTRATVIDR